MKKFLFTMAIFAIGFGLLAASGSDKKSSIMSKLRNVKELKDKRLTEPKLMTPLRGEILRLDNFELVLDGGHVSATVSYDEKNICTLISCELEEDGEAMSGEFRYSYNDKGLLISEILSEEGEDYEKYEYTYNDRGLIASVIYSDNDGEGWRLSDKYEYKYDENNFESECISYEYEVGQWTLDEREEYVNNAEGVLISVTYSKNVEGTGFSYIKRNEFTYNDRWLLVLSLSSFYQNNEWIPSSKTELEYDNNSCTVETCYEYKVDSWNPKTKEERSYDDKGQLSIKNKYMMGQDEWMHIDSENYVYGEQGNILSITNRMSALGEMINFSKREYAYGSGSLAMSSETYYQWRDNDWQFDGKNDYEYYQPLSYTIYGTDNKFNGVSKLVDDFEMFYNEHNGYVLLSLKRTNSTESVHKSTCSYTSLGTENGIKEAFGTLPVCLYPNPTEDVINIEVEDITNSTIEVYNMRGQLLVKDMATPTLSLKTLDAGVYFVKVIGTNTYHVERVIKR